MASALERLLSPPQRLSALQSLIRQPTPARLFAGGPISDVFDFLSVGQYAGAGLLTGRGVGRGIEERTSYGELLSPGFRQSIPGRVAEFGMNVLGDPLTYMPVGGWAVKGVRMVPGGARAISLAKAPVRALAERAGLAIPETIRAAGAVEGLAETSLEPLREVLRGVRSEQALARIEAAVFSRGIRQDALQTARGNRQAAGHLLQAASEYFDVPGRVVVEGLEAERQALAGAARSVRAEFVSAQRRAVGETARQTAGTIQRTASEALSGLQDAVSQAVQSARGLTDQAQQQILFRAAEAAADVAAKGGTARQAEIFVAKAISQAMRSAGKPELEQTVVRAFREAAAPLTRGRTFEAARGIAATVRGQLRGLRQTAEEAAAATLDPEALARVRGTALQARDTWLQTLPDDARGFVQRWGERVAQQHEGDLQRLVDLGMLTPERADLWRSVYLRNSYLRHVDPEQYAKLIAEVAPREAAQVLAGVERAARFGGTAGGIPGRAQIRPRKLPEETARLAHTAIRDIDQRYALQRTLNAELIGRGELNSQAARLYALPEDAVDRLAQGLPDFARLFRPMPSEARWGDLAGRWVPKEVHNILTAIAWKPEGLAATWTKLISAWKLGKVAMPSTIRRNLTSNFSLIQSRFGSRGLGGVVRELPEAFNDVRNASDLYLRAVRAHPGFGSSQLDAEVRDLLKAAGTPQDARGMADAIVGAVQTVGRPFTTAYEFSELVPKMAVFRWGVKTGLSDKAAAVQSMLALFDYGDVPPAILAMRRWGLYPFATFPYKVATQAIPAALERPGRLAQQVKLVRALTVPETEEERRALPAQLRSGGFVKLPFTDSKGRPIFYDLTYELFFGDLGEPGTPIGQAVAALQGKVRPSEAIPTFLTPIGQVAAEIAANKSFFTGQPVYRPEEPAALAVGRHIARAALPGPVFSLAETAATPALRALGLKPTSVLARAAYGVPTARGIEPVSVPAAVAQTFGGFRTVPLDVQRQQAANTAGYRAALADLERRITSIQRDRSLQPTEKTMLIRRIVEQRRSLVERFAREGAIE